MMRAMRSVDVGQPSRERLLIVRRDCREAYRLVRAWPFCGAQPRCLTCHTTARATITDGLL